MGTNVADVEAKVAVCAGDPTVVNYSLVAEQDTGPALDMNKPITHAQYWALADAASNMSTFSAEMQAVAPGFWGSLPQSPANPGKSSLYNAFASIRSGAMSL